MSWLITSSIHFTRRFSRLHVSCVINKSQRIDNPSVMSLSFSFNDSVAYRHNDAC